jgi:fatty-acyl-CoA synthase
VQATHRGVLASMLGIVVAHRVGAESRCLTVLPLFHVAGLNLFANPVLWAGGTVLVDRAFDPARALHLLTDPATPVTHFCGVPANYQFMQQLPGFAEARLRPFVAVVGGSPVPQALVAAWAALGIALTTVYGITEAGACVTAMPPGRELDHNGTIGLPLLYARCRVRTPEDRPAAPGQTGELQLSGPLVTPGYWRNPAATADAFTTDGWLRTGDAATTTDDGHLVLVDRWKDMYISGGENVYPAEVENVLHAHPAVSQAAVVGTSHPRWGEAGTAFVVPAQGAAPTEEELRSWCRERLAAYKVPVRVVLVEELPRNATGKVLKAPLRATAHGYS